MLDNKYLVIVRYINKSINTFYYDKLEDALKIYKFALNRLGVSKVYIYEKAPDIGEAYHKIK